jgi:hypothetical protein
MEIFSQNSRPLLESYMHFEKLRKWNHTSVYLWDLLKSGA